MADLPVGEVYIARPGTEPGEDGWTHIGETAGASFEFTPQIPVPDLPIPWPPSPITLTIAVDTSDAQAKLRRLIHLMTGWICQSKREEHLQEHAGSYSRCRTCHPEQAPRPLAVDGREYHRRQRARRQRHAH